MNSNTTQHRHNFSIFRLSIVALLLLGFSAPIHADVFRSTSSYRVDARPMEATQVDPTTQYQTYESVIYEPFAEETPSSSSNGPRKTTGTGSWGGGGMGDEEGDDAGHRDPNSPIGEAWVMLVFAAMAAVVIALRKKQTA